MFELSAQQQSAIDSKSGAPLIVVDQRTHATYVLIPSGVFERLNRHAPHQPPIESEPAEPEIPEGIRRSKAALRRDLSELLARRRNRGM